MQGEPTTLFWFDFWWLSLTAVWDLLSRYPYTRQSFETHMGNYRGTQWFVRFGDCLVPISSATDAEAKEFLSASRTPSSSLPVLIQSWNRTQTPICSGQEAHLDFLNRTVTTLTWKEWFSHHSLFTVVVVTRLDGGICMRGPLRTPIKAILRLHLVASSSVSARFWSGPVWRSCSWASRSPLGGNDDECVVRRREYELAPLEEQTSSATDAAVLPGYHHDHYSSKYKAGILSNEGAPQRTSGTQ